MPPYNALLTQSLFRQVENGQYRVLPGADLVVRLYEQLRIADDLIAEQAIAIKAVGGRPDPRLAPVYTVPARVLPSAENPLGRPAEGTPSEIQVAPPPRMAAPLPSTPLVPPSAPGASGASSPFFGGARQEAPPPIPFKDTPQGLEAATDAAAAAPKEEPKTRGRPRRKHIAP